MAHTTESDDLPMATMTSSTSKLKNLLSNRSFQIGPPCKYWKEKGHMVNDCEKLKKKKKKDAQKRKPTQKKVYPQCGTCGKKSQPKEECWQDAGAHLKPKRTRLEDPQYNSTSSGFKSTSKENGQKTIFATNPTQRSNISPTIRQIGSFNKRPISTAFDGV